MGLFSILGAGGQDSWLLVSQDEAGLTERLPGLPQSRLELWTQAPVGTCGGGRAWGWRAATEAFSRHRGSHRKT